MVARSEFGRSRRKDCEMNAERADNRGGTAVPRATTVATDDTGELTREAWRTSGARWRAGAVAVAVVALACTLHGGIPLASGVGVAALVPAALVDRRTARLPDPLVALAATLVVLVATLEARAGVVVEVRGALLGAAVLAGPLLALHLLSPDAMGFGDVKAGLVLGAALGLTDWQIALVALAIATAATAVVGLARRASAVPFGPGLVVGGAAALVLALILIPGDDTTSGDVRSGPAPVVHDGTTRTAGATEAP
jgi:leader peptidase (prepilin peptidase)/N-methyltransferase